MKKFFSNIIVDLILFDLFFGVTYLIVDKLGLEYLKWVKQTVLIVNCIGIVLGIIQLIIKIENKTEKIIMIVLVIINLMIFSRFILGIIAFFIYYLYPSEYIVERENEKMVGYVVNGYETRVDYYRYKNIFTREKNRVYIDTIQENENSEEKKQEKNEESAILCEKKINENIAIRVKRECFILAQRCVITIQKTIDGGSNWHTESDGITINNDAELYIDNVPCKEKNALKVKVCIIENSEEKYYYLYSEDNGLNWKMESEKE